MIGDTLIANLYYKDYIVIISASSFLLLGILLNLFACCCGCLSKQPVRDSILDDSDGSLVSNPEFSEQPGSGDINGTPSQRSYAGTGPPNVNDISEVRSYSQQPGVFGQGDEYLDMNLLKSKRPPKAVGKRPKKGLIKTEYSDKKSCWSFFEVLFSWLGWICIGLMFLGISGFGYMPSYVSGLLMFFILVIKFWREIYKMCPLVYRNRKVFKTGCCSLRPIIQRAKIFGIVYSHNKCLVTFQIFFIIILSVFLPFATTGSCLCFHNQGWGLPLLGGVWNYNSELIRQWTVGTVCPEGKICHVYVTVPEDALTSAFVNIHTGVDIESLEVNYASAQQENNGSSAQIQSVPIEGLEKLGKRHIFTAYLEGLTSNTQYTIEIIYNGQTLKKTYKTPPNGTDKPLVLAIGGDVGNTEVTDAITTLATTNFKPDAFYIGGNLAYDNNIRQCYYAYDKAISRFEASYDKLGYMVPLVLAIGNHDMGLGPENTREIPRDSTSPLFMIYFPQHGSSDPNNKIPELSERRTYHYHTIGDSIFTILDTGYAVPIKNQTAWLEKTLTANEKSAKFAAYHNPIFTPCWEPTTPQTLSLTQWVPLFDKHKIMAAFESRNNALKKTFPLKNNERVENGTYYLGEGAWGVEPVSGCVGNSIQNKTGIYENVQKANHIWIMVYDKTKNQVQYTAYSKDGNMLINTFSQDISIYTEGN